MISEIETTDTEEWKVIEGFPRYQISNMGNLKGPRSPLLKPGLDSDGYRQIHLYRKDGLGYRGGGRYTFKVYRLVMNAFSEKPEGTTQIDHINRNKQDDRLVNLRWVNARENTLNRGKPIEMTGINWNKRNQTYMVRVYAGIGKKQIYLGCRKNVEDAKTLRDDYYNKHNVTSDNETNQY